MCISSINLYKKLLDVAIKKVKIALSELTNAASALEQDFILFKHLQASKTEHSVSVFLVVEKKPLFKPGVLKAPLYYILFTKRGFGKFKCRSWMCRRVWKVIQGREINACRYTVSSTWKRRFPRDRLTLNR